MSELYFRKNLGDIRKVDKTGGGRMYKRIEVL